MLERRRANTDKYDLTGLDPFLETFCEVKSPFAHDP